MKIFFLFPFLLFAVISSAQTTERKNIQGNITVPEGYKPEGIHIYNKTSGYGTSSDAEGFFELPMASGDTLHFSAIQFEALEVVIIQDIIESGSISVEIKEGLNELPEILVRSHELTGNVREDLDRIDVPQLPAIPPMPDLRKIPVEKLSPKNTAMSEIGGGANHLALLIKGIKLLLPKRKKKEAPPKTEWTIYEQVVLEKELRSRFDDQFFLDNFGVEVAEISAFVDYVAESGFRENLLKKEKEMELIQFLMEHSKEFDQPK